MKKALLGLMIASLQAQTIVEPNTGLVLTLPNSPSSGSFTVASEAEVAAGTDNTKGITPLRLAQSLDRCTVTKTSATVLDIGACTIIANGRPVSIMAGSWTITRVSVTAATAASSAVLTHGAIPSDAIQIGQSLGINGVTGTGFTALNGVQQITAIGSTTSTTVSVNTTGATGFGAGTLGYNASASGTCYIYGTSGGQAAIECPDANGLIVDPAGSASSRYPSTSDWDEGSFPIASITIVGTNGGEWGTLTPVESVQSVPYLPPGRGIEIASSTIRTTTDVPLKSEANTFSASQSFSAGATCSGTCTGFGSSFDPRQAGSMLFQDDFLWLQALGGGLGTKIGSGGMYCYTIFTPIGTCSPVSSATEANHPGLVRLTSSTTDNTETDLSMDTGSTSGNGPNANTIYGVTWEVLFRTSSDISSQVVGVGYSNYGSVITANGVGIYYDTDAGDTNWMCQISDSDSNSRASTGVTVATSTWYRATLTFTTAGTITCSVNGSSPVTQTGASHFNATQGTFTIGIGSRAAAARTVDVDKVTLYSNNGITR